MPRFLAHSVVPFLSTPSARRATLSSLFSVSFPVISIHALREEGDLLLVFVDAFFFVISIHALREEGDLRPQLAMPLWFLISIHALREEGDRWTVGTTATNTQFLSTPSARRATLDSWHYGDKYTISIHALREEGDGSSTQ